MQFEYHPIDSLPRLAWCAMVSRGKGTIDVFHGPWVETREGFFTDGAWDGDFEQGQMHRSLHPMGFGARCIEDRAVFCCPCHPMERLHLAASEQSLILSPSLCFVLAMSGQSLDIQYPYYHADFISFVSGIDRHVGSIPLSGGKSLRVFHYRNLWIDQDLGLEVRYKAAPPDFEDFHDYRTFLVKTLNTLRSNAEDPRRKKPYRFLATVSTGYDSPCCAALSAEAGCREGVSFRTARPESVPSGHTEDSGLAIGKILGLDVREFDRDAYMKKPGWPEAEFVACGDQGQDLAMTAFEEAFEQRMVVTGVHGDIVWGVEPTYPETQWWLGAPAKDIVRHDPGLCSLVEFRMRTGFIHVPLPFVGGLSYPSILEISRGEEMRPWRLGNRYDRPIPRRILEEKGVPRAAFGQDKKATTVLLNRDATILNRMNPASAQSFEDYYRRHSPERRASRQKIALVMNRLYRTQAGILSRVNAALRKARIPIAIQGPISERYSQSPGRPSWLVHWALEAIRDRYAGALEMHRQIEKERTSKTPPGA